jgi:hypothetical protein
MNQTLTLRVTKPRNHWAAAAFRSGAGAHRRSASSHRQQARLALRHELSDDDRHRRTP